MSGQFEYRQERFLGLNQSPDEVFSLKKGESPYLVNFSVGEGYSLKKRKGYSVLCRHDGEGRGIASLVNGKGEWIVYVVNDDVYALKNGNNTLIGKLESGSGQVDFLRFSQKLYILDGKKIKVFDGESFSDIEPYRPLVAISTTPNGAGTHFEEKNLLTGRMRQSFTMNSTNTILRLSLDKLDSVDYVKVDGVELSKNLYTYSLEYGTVTLPDKYSNHPTVDGIEIGFTKNDGSESLIHSMRHAASYGGENDTRIFLYGDAENSNIIRYSGVYNGTSGFEYFPESHFNKIGSVRGITSVIRHFDRLVCFCPSEAFYCYEEKTVDENGKVYSVFPIRPLSDSVGCEAYGFAVSINSFPVTFDKGTLYRWRSSSVRDERYAEDIGKRIKTGLSLWDTVGVRSFDSEGTYELFVWYKDEIYVYNYSLDVFYFWKGISPCGFATLENSKILFLSADGLLCSLFDSDSDGGRPIEAVWESPYLEMAHGVKNLYSVCVEVFPDFNTCADSFWISDKGESLSQKVEGVYRRLSFENTDFSAFGFMTGVSSRKIRYRQRHKRFERLKVKFVSPGGSSLHMTGFSVSGLVTSIK